MFVDFWGMEEGDTFDDEFAYYEQKSIQNNDCITYTSVNL